MGLARIMAHSDSIPPNDNTALGRVNVSPNHSVAFDISTTLDGQNPTLSMKYYDANGTPGPSFQLNRDGYVGQAPLNQPLVRAHALKVLEHVERNAGKVGLGESPEGIETVSDLRKSIAEQASRVRVSPPGLTAGN